MAAKKKAAPKKKDGIRIAKVEVRDFHRLSVAQVEYVPEQGLVTVTGKNAAGKTSLLKAVAAALGGGKQIRSDTIREGADSGEVRLELTNGFTVKRWFSENNPKGSLKVIGPDGGKHKQGTLSVWLGERSFDPLAFFSLKPAEQRDVLLSIATDEDLPAKLSDLQERFDSLYAQRTPWFSKKQVAERMERPDGEKPSPIDVNEEMGKLQELQAAQVQRSDAERTAYQAKTDMHGRDDDVVRAENRVKELEAELAEANENVATAKERQATAVTKLEKAIDEFEAIPDQSEAMNEVTGRINKAKEMDELMKPWLAFEQAQVDITESRVKIAELKSQMDEVDADRAALLANSGIPVADLSFSEEGEPLLNGRPLEVASGRERIDMAVNVAIAADPLMKVCLLDEANDLDTDALKRLDEHAKKHGFQVWIARISEDAGTDVVVADGKAQDSKTLAIEEEEQAMDEVDRDTLRDVTDNS